MSAYVVSKSQIDVLVAAGARLVIDHYEMTEDHLNRVGQMLLDECVRSVSHRYPDSEDLPGSYVEETAEYVTPYEYNGDGRELFREDVEDEIGCYEYQACEHPGWDGSWAFQYCKALRAQLHTFPPRPKAEPSDGRSYGYKYGEGGRLDTAAIAKLIRKEIKAAISEGLLPDRWAYSVVTDRFSGGSSIDVRVKKCADAWMPCPGYKLGTKHELSGGGWTATGCGDPWCKAGGIHKDRPEAREHDVLTEEARVAKMTLERIHGAYNHDGSDTMTDYFDVNYYGTVSFQSAQSARWEAEEKSRKAAKRAALDAATETFRVKVYGRQGQTVHLAAKVEGNARLVCGAQLRRSSLYSKTDDAVTCSRCARKEA